VSLLLNGFVGPIRMCLEYGLPQGSVLSPILFKFYVHDIEAVCQLYQQVSFFKFADDGTVKVAGEDLDECILYLSIVLGSITNWTAQWRMVINCDINKTEIVCFSCSDPEKIPKSYNIGGKLIYLTEQTKVLGVVMDKQLSFKGHSLAVYNKLVYRWVCLCRYSNRTWGLNQAVMIRIVKTIMFSSLFYGCMVWMTNANMASIHSLWYKVAKSALGAVYNVQNALLEVILGVPPLQVAKRIITTKHYLKVFSDPPDIHLEFIIAEIKHGNVIIDCHLRDVFRFLQWKLDKYPTVFTTIDEVIIRNQSPEQLHLLTVRACTYTKTTMRLFTEALWQESLNNQLQMEGWSKTPTVSTLPLKMPPSTSREEEVLVMSLFYKNNLLNSFLYRTERKLCPSPVCLCGEEEQTAFHLLCNCTLIDIEIREKLVYHLTLGNDAVSMDELEADHVSLLNCSRDVKFIELCREVIMTDGLNLRTKIRLSRPNSKNSNNSRTMDRQADPSL
jgi:hypothetical protein